MKKLAVFILCVLLGNTIAKAQIIVSKTSPDNDLAIHADASASDNGWGGGSSKTDLTDGIRTYDGEWARGLAFAYNEWHQVTINFGHQVTFNKVIQWYHGGMNNNEAAAYKLQYWNGSSWVDILETNNSHDCLKYPSAVESDWYYYWSAPYENTFSPVISDKLRILNYPRSGSHTWLYEVEVYNNNTTSISIPSLTANWQQPIEVPIASTELKPDSNYISYQFNLNYDNTKLQYSNKSLVGTIAENGTLLVNETSPGSLAVSYMTASPLQGAGNIAKLEFNTINVGTAPLTISNFLYNNTSVTAENGTVIIQDITPPTAAITYSDADGNVRYGEDLIITATFSEPMANSPVPQIILSGANTLAAANMTKVSETVYTYTHSVALGNGAVTVSLATGTDTHGNVVTSAPTSGNTFTVIPITYGDVDDNKFIRAYDAALTLQYSVGLNPLPLIDPLPWEAWRIVTANVDGVGSITAYDASLILQYSAGIITVFPAGSKKSGKESAEIEVAVEKGFALFRSKGDLYGLNISVAKGFNNLGQPQILNSNMISAANISETNYTIGLATAYPPKNGDVFMKIPITGSTNSDVTFNLISNTDNVAITVSLATDIPEIKENTLSMFPNPVTNQLTINSINRNAKVSIYDLAGKLLICKTAKSTTEIIDVSSLSSGTYTVTVTDKEVTKTGKLIKQ